MSYYHIPKNLLVEGDLTNQVSLTESASFNSNVISASNNRRSVGLQLTTSSESSLAGTAKIQTSLDGINWDDYPNTQITLPYTTTTQHTKLWDLGYTGSYNFRVAVTLSAGSAKFLILGWAN